MHNDFSSSLVSIVICTYNGKLYLETQLKSIINQTYPNIEIIAIDDCSTDNTIDILNAYAIQYKNLKIIQNTTNIGYIKNFEKGISLSKGHFIAPCDQDDVWESNKIELMMAAIENYCMIYCDSELVDAHLNSLHRKISDLKNSKSYNNCLPFIIANCVSGHALLMKRELFNLSIPFPDYIIYDHWLAYVATLHGGVKYISDVLVKYRNHAGNTIGAVRMKKKKRKSLSKKLKEKKQQIAIARKKIEVFYNICPRNKPEKEILYNLMISYKSFSLKNNIKRVGIFLKYRNQLLAIKKRSGFRKWLFCFKMFFKIK